MSALDSLLPRKRKVKGKTSNKRKSGSGSMGCQPCGADILVRRRLPTKKRFEAKKRFEGARLSAAPYKSSKHWL
jgi:DNA-directed RNA polymerase subunit RPC12/RpoP